MNDTWTLLLVALLPSLLVFLTTFYTLRQFFGAQAAERRAELRKDDHKQVLPLRLQAYERLTLYLERIAPGPLVLRVHKHNMSARMLHGELISTVREELDHNVTQQVYVSDKAWARVKQAKEETIRLVNIAYEGCPDQAPGTELSQRVFETASRLSHMPSQEAVLVLKEEVRRLF